MLFIFTMDLVSHVCGRETQTAPIEFIETITEIKVTWRWMASRIGSKWYLWHNIFKLFTIYICLCIHQCLIVAATILFTFMFTMTGPMVTYCRQFSWLKLFKKLSTNKIRQINRESRNCNWFLARLFVLYWLPDSLELRIYFFKLTKMTPNECNRIHWEVK